MSCEHHTAWWFAAGAVGKVELDFQHCEISNLVGCVSRACERDVIFAKCVKEL